MSAQPAGRPLTADELTTIRARAEASAGVAGFATIHYALAREDVPRLVAEIERLQAIVRPDNGAAIAPPVITPNATPFDVCTCLACGPPYRDEHPDWGTQRFASWMALCPTCGSKRCPGANRHDRHPA